MKKQFRLEAIKLMQGFPDWACEYRDFYENDLRVTFEKDSRFISISHDSSGWLVHLLEFETMEGAFAAARELLRNEELKGVINDAR